MTDHTDLHAPGVDIAALLKRIAKQFDGVVPNVYRTLAQTPSALHTFVEAEHALETSCLLNAAEHSCVALEVSNHADCAYCRSVFILEARRHGVAEADIAAIARGGRPDDARCRLISHATRRILSTGGRLGRAEIAELEREGLDRPRLIEIVTVIGVYTIATYANNLTRTRIDPEFRVADFPQSDGENGRT